MLHEIIGTIDFFLPGILMGLMVSFVFVFSTKICDGSGPKIALKTSVLAVIKVLASVLFILSAYAIMHWVFELTFA